MPFSYATRRFALCALFFLPGFGHATWITRTPELRDTLNASTDAMGLILFGLSVGSIVGILSSGYLTTKLGTRSTIKVGLLILATGLVVLAASAYWPNAVLAFAGLTLFGLGVAGMEVAVNVEGATLEGITGRSLLPVLHGCFSLGTLVGGVIGMLMVSLALPIAAHLLASAVVCLLVTAAMIRTIPAACSRGSSAHRGGSFVSVYLEELRDFRLLFIGVFVLALALAEGAANDWLPLLMVDGYGMTPTQGSTVFVLFACAMTFGRFTGGYVVQRLGSAIVMRASAVSAAVSLFVVIVADQAVVGAAAVSFWGLGAALGFPLGISAAAVGPNSAIRVSLVATLGYSAFLVGPPTLGFIGEHFGLRFAFLPVFGLACVAVLSVGGVTAKRRGALERC